MSPFHYFPYITNLLLSSFTLSADRLSRFIKRDEPKGSLSSPRLLHFRLSYCLLSLLSSVQKTSFHTIPYLLQLVVQRYLVYLTSLVVPELAVSCVLFLSTCVPPPSTPRLPLLIAFPRVDSLLSSLSSSCSISLTFPPYVHRARAAKQVPFPELMALFPIPSWAHQLHVSHVYDSSPSFRDRKTYFPIRVDHP
jgi:hypothetical protein